MTERIRNEVREEVGERRFAHVLGTEWECRSLAALFSLTPEETEQLAAAALLHDITKHYTREEHIAFMESIGKPIPEETLRSEKTLHALTGAFLARARYPDVTDDAVFSAILFHTTGKEDMSLIQKLMYLADYIEPTRTFPDCVALRDFFTRRVGEGDLMRVLNETLILSFDMTVSELLRSRQPIHPDTVAARNFLLLQETGELK